MINIGCYHPRIRIQNNLAPYINKQGGISYQHKWIPTPNITKALSMKQELEALGKKVQICPCGECIGCFLEKSAQWATRCMLESTYWEHNYFITLTYSDDKLIYYDKMDTETGEVGEKAEIPTILKVEMKKFMKDLRSYYKYHYNHDNIRFYGCGEYGSKSGRPHYHIILFNCMIPDLEFYKINESGEPMWLSKSLSKIWGKGHVVVGEVTWNSCAYVARYVTKKIFGMKVPKENYISQGLEPEFTNMSRKPGIGLQYYLDHEEEIVKGDKIIIKKHDGSIIEYSAPEYFKKQLKKRLPQEEYEKIQKRQEEISEKIRDLKMSKTTLSYNEQLEVEERTKKMKLAALKRQTI